MDNGKSRRTVGIVFQILGLIAFCFEILVYSSLYKILKGHSGNIAEILFGSLVLVALYAILAIIFFIFEIVSSVIIARARRLYGRTFSGFLCNTIGLIAQCVFIAATIVLFVN